MQVHIGEVERDEPACERVRIMRDPGFRAAADIADAAGLLNGLNPSFPLAAGAGGEAVA